jgi:hypothetical protein
MDLAPGAFTGLTCSIQRRDIGGKVLGDLRASRASRRRERRRQEVVEGVFDKNGIFPTTPEAGAGPAEWHHFLGRPRMASDRNRPKTSAMLLDYHHEDDGQGDRPGAA